MYLSVSGAVLLVPPVDGSHCFPLEALSPAAGRWSPAPGLWVLTWHRHLCPGDTCWGFLFQENISCDNTVFREVTGAERRPSRGRKALLAYPSPLTLRECPVPPSSKAASFQEDIALHLLRGPPCWMPGSRRCPGPGAQACPHNAPPVSSLFFCPEDVTILSLPEKWQLHLWVGGCCGSGVQPPPQINSFSWAWSWTVPRAVLRSRGPAEQGGGFWFGENAYVLFLQLCLVQTWLCF